MEMCNHSGMQVLMALAAMHVRGTSIGYARLGYQSWGSSTTWANWARSTGIPLFLQ
ncbi:MAG TPA: hypothetical protein VKM55_20235 [Candidatus Lokiarchaeia archaeon]|nr:hypothetical protein [Candidatus Lokiarchaeia archaeon]